MLKENESNKYKYATIMIIFSSFSLALMAGMIKYLNSVPLLEILFFRNIAIIIIIPLIIKNKKIYFWGNNKPLLILCAMLAGFVTMAYFYSITKMKLADAVTIKQLGPFFIILLSVVFLRRKISFKLIVIFVFAFLGILLIVKPGFNSDIYPAIIGLLGASLMAVNHMFLNYLCVREHPLVIVNYCGYIIGCY